MKDHLKNNLFVIVENNVTYVTLEKWAKVWDINHSDAVKRAGSIIVIRDGQVDKNLFKDEQ